QQPARQFGNAEQAQHAPRAWLDLDQLPVLDRDRQAALKVRDPEPRRAARPARVQARLAVAACQPAAVAEAAEQRAEVLAAHVGLQPGPGVRAAAQPVATDVDALLLRTGQQALHAQPGGNRARAHFRLA